jgi:hypothetical protein
MATVHPSTQYNVLPGSLGRSEQQILSCLIVEVPAYERGQSLADPPRTHRLDATPARIMRGKRPTGPIGAMAQ